MDKLSAVFSVPCPWLELLYLRQTRPIFPCVYILDVRICVPQWISLDVLQKNVTEIAYSCLSLPLVQNHVEFVQISTCLDVLCLVSVCQNDTLKFVMTLILQKPRYGFALYWSKKNLNIMQQIFRCLVCVFATTLLQQLMQQLIRCLVSGQQVFPCPNVTLNVCNYTLTFGKQGMILLCIEAKRFVENMFFCTSREVACQEVVRQGMLLKGTENFHNLQMFPTISIT